MSSYQTSAARKYSCGQKYPYCLCITIMKAADPVEGLRVEHIFRTSILRVRTEVTIIILISTLDYDRSVGKLSFTVIQVQFEEFAKFAKSVNRRTSSPFSLRNRFINLTILTGDMSTES